MLTNLRLETFQRLHQNSAKNALRIRICHAKILAWESTTKSRLAHLLRTPRKAEVGLRADADAECPHPFLRLTATSSRLFP